MFSGVPARLGEPWKRAETITIGREKLNKIWSQVRPKKLRRRYRAKHRTSCENRTPASKFNLLRARA
jgi:hypothetical protein